MMICSFSLQTKSCLLVRGLVLVTFLLFCISMQAQVTIGSAKPPHEDALLDLNEGDVDGLSKKGLLMPRVELISTDNSAPLSKHVKGMVVFNTLKQNDVDLGLYANDGEKWIKVGSGNKQGWFYMPFVSLNLTIGEHEIDLFSMFKSQFYNIPDTSRSPGASMSIPVGIEYEEDDSSKFNYFVTNYDEDIVDILGISSNGILKYKVKQEPYQYTYMNVIFSMK